MSKICKTTTHIIIALFYADVKFPYLSKYPNALAPEGGENIRLFKSNMYRALSRAKYIALTFP